METILLNGNPGSLVRRLRFVAKQSSAVDAAEAKAAAEDPIDLKDPVVAAILAWLIPGLGHWYQGRRSKAILFFVCILGTFVYGLYLGEGRVVYASWRQYDRRLPYFCQIGVGLPALPALIQAQRFRNEGLRLAAEERARLGEARFTDWFMAPPQVSNPANQNDHADELDRIQYRLNRFFELGLLNVLAIYDAWGGPAYSEPVEKRKTEDDEEPAGKT
jgi:hypothetical protein